jgi:hypothetical protein
VKRVKKQISSRWPCRDLGEVQKFLGLIVTRISETRTIHISQQLLVEECLAEMVTENGNNMTDCMPCVSPFDLKELLQKSSPDSRPLSVKLSRTYHTVVATLPKPFLFLAQFVNNKSISSCHRDELDKLL